MKKRIILYSTLTIVLAIASSLVYFNYVMSSPDPSCAGLQHGELVQLPNDAYIFQVEKHNNDIELIPSDKGIQRTWQYPVTTKIISKKCFDSVIPSIKNVNFRPGSYLVKYRRSDQLFAILPNNTLAKISTSTAKLFYGNRKGKYPVTNLHAFSWSQFNNRADEIQNDKLHPGLLISPDKGKTIYYVDEEYNLREVTSAGFIANRFQKIFVKKFIPKELIEKMKVVGKIDKELPHLIDKSQLTKYSYPITTPAPTPTTTPSPTTTPNPQPQPSYGDQYFIRTDGGNFEQCDGSMNVAYSTSIQNKKCAWSHPFVALPPESNARIKGGDTLVIANGNYKMGLGAPNTSNCSSDYPWDCMASKIPAGLSADQPTRIIGENWNNGCSTKPQLYGVERARYILNLADSSNVQIQCLEITDHSSCIEFHSGSNSCNRNRYPYGSWAGTGIYAEDSKNVLLNNLDIHGLANRGILAGRLQNWTIKNTNIDGNGWVGWDGDIDGSDGNSGTMYFKGVSISWNGCGETYPARQPVGCWSQTAGGYGDGLGTGQTGGNWIFEDSNISYNTSDGLDLLYHRNGGSITIRRSHFEGNAGNQVKTNGDAIITDSVIVGNCAYFQGKSFTYNVDNCRALGNALSIGMTGVTAPVLVYNNSVYSNGDGLLFAEGSGTVKVRNNIFYAGTDYHQPSENSFYLYSEGGTKFDQDYNLMYKAKDSNEYCSKGDNNLCNIDPKFVSIDSNFNLKLNVDSPAINKGTTAISSIDYVGNKRTQGSAVDMGAYEMK